MANYIISIGGTGERIMRAIIHLCDCGVFGKEEIKLTILDPDVNGGSKDELEEAIKKYAECREAFYMENSDLFQTPISIAHPQGILSISPVQFGEDAATQDVFIKDFVAKENIAEATNFMKAIYTRKEYEEIDMAEGFYAHPSIGTWSFSRWLEQSHQFNKIVEKIGHDAETEKVKIVIIASAFGGTGAAGFPIVAAYIKSKLKRYFNNDGQIMMSGIFMMPYFTILKNKDARIDIDSFDEDGADVEGQTIDDTSFGEAAKSAVAFYREYESAKDYDRIYVLGAPSRVDNARPIKIPRNKYADKGAGQKNWPHMMEFFGALAAKDFFTNFTAKDRSANHKDAWVGIGIDKDDFYRLSWEDFPDGESIRKKMCTFLLFNYIFIPAVLSRFTHLKDRKLVRLEPKDVKWSAVEKEPFMNTPFFGKKTWNDESFGQGTGFKNVVLIYDYFNLHITWLYRLMTEYNEEGSGRLLFSQLLCGEMLSTRYKDISRLSNETAKFSTLVREMEINNNDIGRKSFIGNNQDIQYNILFDKIKNGTPSKVKERSDATKAFREIMQIVFDIVSNEVR